MKKIYYILSVIAAALLVSCENFNEKNFPGYDEAATPTNLVSYSYELTTSDYAAIANVIKKPIEDKITYQNNLIKNKEIELKTATNSTDSARIKTELGALKTLVNDSINKLKKDSLYITATGISTNKYFIDSIQFIKAIPLLLNTKYIYSDEKSSAMIRFNLIVPYDTTKMTAANKYTFLQSDYDAISTQLGLASDKKISKFNSTYNPDVYVPIYLKTNKFPYAISGDVKMIYYTYDTKVKYDIYKYDGINWIKYNLNQSVKAKFVCKSSKWEFIDADILTGLYDGLGDFIAINVVGEQVWGWDSYKYAKMTGFVSGSYFTNEDWLISPPMNLMYRNSPWLTFTHVGRYFGDSGTSTDKMRKAITLWVSTKFNGETLNPDEWTQLTIPEAGYPSGANWTFIPSTPISLAAYIRNENVRIAFKYMSSNADGAAGTWEVKNVYVYEE
jgi:hypothetical protein